MNPIRLINAYLEKLENESNLKPTSQSIYMALYKINNKCGWKEKFQATFGQSLNITGIANVKTYYSALEELVAGGYIIWKKSPNQYKAATFIMVKLYQITEEHTVLQTEEHTVLTNKCLRKSTSNILKPINNKNLNIDFYVFWDLYDHKKDKPACEKLWQKLNDPDRDNIIKNTPAYIQSTPDRTYRKHPKTYLNNRSWENDTPAAAGTNTGLVKDSQPVDPIKAFKEKKQRNQAISR